jgi:hypothetical protein
LGQATMPAGVRAPLIIPETADACQSWPQA